MNKMAALHAFRELDRRGIYVLTKGDIEKLFPAEGAKTLEKSLQRLVRDGILERVSKGVYLNPMAASRKNYVVEDIAVALRRGFFSYVSLESMLSEYGVISQVPARRLTVMTTGAKGSYNTPYGTIEFTHTKRRPADILQRTVYVDTRPLRIATQAAALKDLLRVGRNTEMVIGTEIR